MVNVTENTNEIKAVSLDELPEVLDIDGACALLGVGKNSLYYLLERKRIPARKCGKGYRFLKSRLLEWLRGDELAK